MTDENLEREERVSGSPAIPNQAMLQAGLEYREKLMKAQPLATSDIFTVVYFMPDGDAIIRYEKADPANPFVGERSSFLAMQAFAVVKVLPSINDGTPGLEFLKCRFDLKDLIRSRLETPKTFPISD